MSKHLHRALPEALEEQPAAPIIEPAIQNTPAAWLPEVTPAVLTDAAPSPFEHFADVEQVAARPGAQPQRPTPEQLFNQQYDEQAARALDEDRRDLGRWRQLTAEEQLAAAGQDPETAVQAGQLGYTTRVNGQMYRYDQIQEDPNAPTLTSALMGPEASQFFSRAFVTDRPREDPNNADERAYQDVMVLNSDGTTSTISQNDHGMVELPESGFGYSTYNRNDVNLPSGEEQKDQWGTPSTVANLINIANDYRTLLPNQTIEYGDLATEDNQSPLLDTGRTRRHATHGQGDQVDLRYPDTMFNTNSYIRTAENWGANNFYYSPGMVNTAFFGDDSRAITEASHRDHLHLGFGRGGR
jgi:hypothetical protein